jgi:peptidoglycan/LPS O-acetylase OafA/YrhL
VAIAFVLLIMTGFWLYLSFAVGVAISELTDRRGIRGNHVAGLMLIIGGILIASIASLSAFRYYSLIIKQFAGFEADLKIVFSTLGAALLVIGVLLSEMSQSILTNRIPQFLGTISYSLYLTHLPILYTVFAAWFLTAGPSPSTIFLALWAMTFLVVAIVVGYAVTIIADRPATRLTKMRRSPTG